MTELLATLLEEAFDIISNLKGDVYRQLKFPEAEDIIKVAIGMRRSGKSYFLYQTINKLLSEGINKQQILMINFEDDRLLPMDAKGMGALLDSFYTLYPENYNKRCYFFLDEVQNVLDWQLVVRRYFDSKNVQLYLTGSSAKLLSKEISTSLRGRSLATEVWPYNFNEYLIAHNIALPEKPFSQKTFDMMRFHLLAFFEKGGFPGVQHLLKNEWRDMLQSYVDTVILRDIVERHNISNIVLLKYLTTSLLKNAATPFSVNKFFNDIKSQGYKIGKETIHSYMEYIEDAFLVFSVPFYSESARIKHTIPKKIYAIDNGLVNANSLGTNELFIKFFENQVYLDLRRQGKEVYFYKTKDGYEVDFVAVDKDGRRELIQVALDIENAKTAAREHRALQLAEQELGIKEKKILTLKDYLRTYPLFI